MPIRECFRHALLSAPHGRCLQGFAELELREREILGQLRRLDQAHREHSYSTSMRGRNSKLFQGCAAPEREAGAWQAQLGARRNCLGLPDSSEKYGGYSVADANAQNAGQALSYAGHVASELKVIVASDPGLPRSYSISPSKAKFEPSVMPEVQAAGAARQLEFRKSNPWTAYANGPLGVLPDVGEIESRTDEAKRHEESPKTPSADLSVAPSSHVRVPDMAVDEPQEHTARQPEVDGERGGSGAAGGGTPRTARLIAQLREILLDGSAPRTAANSLAHAPSHTLWRQCLRTFPAPVSPHCGSPSPLSGKTN